MFCGRPSLLTAGHSRIFPSVRKLLIAALLLASCDGAGSNQDLPAREELATAVPNGVDLLALRVPRNGGRARVINYPALDSTVWTSSGSVPAISRVLSFEVDAGSLLYSDLRGIARSLDFRLNAVSPATQLRLASLSTADGWNVYGVATTGSVGRSTPSAIFGGAPPTPWTFKTALPARDVFPLSSGALIVVTASDSVTAIYRIFPPDTVPTDSLILPPTLSSFRTSTGDRIYLTDSDGVLGVATRTFELALDTRVRGGVTEVVPTPSGNQLFLRGDSSATVHVLDRYSGRIAERIRFPSPVSALRMDPLGRFLLARAGGSDTTFIVALSNLGYVRSFVTTEWYEDLPHVAWDGSIVVVRERDVHILDPETLESARTVRNGAADFWYFFAWNGFRPPPPGSTEPVYFPVFVDHSDFELPRQQGAQSQGDNAREALLARARADSLARLDSIRRELPTRGIYTVSFAVLRSDSAAVRLASSIRVGGATARVVQAFIDATPIYRVVLGPYQSRSEAEEVGRRSGIAYWVYEGPP